jgi:hypothetical protein
LILCIFTGFYIFEVFELKIDCQSGWRPNEDMKMSAAPSFGAPGSLIFVLVAQLICKTGIFLSFTAKNGHGVPQK